MGKECCFRLSRGGRDEKRVPLKTPAWDTKRYRAVSLQPPRVFRISTERLFPTILEPGLAEASRYPPGGQYLPRFSFGCLPARKWASGFLLAAKCKLMQIDANYTRAGELGFYGPTAMEGAAWFALFSTVFLASQGRGQGKVYFSFSN